MEVTSILLGPLETIFPVLTEQRNQFWYVGKEVLKSLDCLTVFIHVIFHKLWSMPDYLGVMLQSYEYMSFILYIWERYLILIQVCSTSQTVVPKYWQCSLSHFFLPTFLNIFTSYSFFNNFWSCYNFVLSFQASLRNGVQSVMSCLKIIVSRCKGYILVFDLCYLMTLLITKII